MMRHSGSVAFVIPCFNEELTIKQVVEDCRRAIPEAVIFVFDNNSTDQTASRAAAAGAKVVASSRQGKGNVMQHAFSVIDADVLIMLDGDNTYSAPLAVSMVQAVLDEKYDMVVCHRKSQIDSNAFPRFHRLGNFLFSQFVGGLLAYKVSDVFSGYRAISREFYESIVLDSAGFEVESELTLKAVSHGFAVKELEGPYLGRPQGSHSKLKTFRDGFRILKFIFLAMRDCRPLPFFGFAAGMCFILSLISGAAPIADYMQYQYVHTVPRAVLAASLMVLSSMLLGVGFILDSQMRNFRQQSKLMRRWLFKKNESPEASPKPRLAG